MTDTELLARTVLLFHRCAPWTDADRTEWLLLTGEKEATTKVLCDLARRLLVLALRDEPAELRAD